MSAPQRDTLTSYLIQVCGLTLPRRPWVDPHLWLAVLAAWPVWWALGHWMGDQMHLPTSMVAWLAFVLWQPVLEELAFRGLLQGQLRQRWPGVMAWSPLSLANMVTTFAFAASHLVQQTPSWAALVIAPSLVMGYLRDRSDSAWPAIALHVYYNLGFALVAWWVHVR